MVLYTPTITGSLNISGSISATGNITAQTLVVQTVSSSVVYSSGSNIFGNSLANTHQFTGSVTITGSLAINGSNAVLSNQTSSMSASYALTASYALNATSASYFSGSISNATTASYALTASYVSGSSSVSASYSATASYVNPLNQTVVITGSLFISSSVSSSLGIRGTGSGVFTVDGTSGRLFQIDDSLSGSLFSVNTAAGLPVVEAFSDNTVRIGQYGQKALFVSQSRVGINKEASLNGTLDISGSAIMTGSLNVSGSFNINGTITATTLVVQTITSSVEYSSGSNVFGNSTANTQQFTGSVLVTGSLNANNTLYVTGSNVGIGITSPQTILDVTKTLNNTYIRATSVGNYETGFQIFNSSLKWQIYVPNSSSDLYFYDGSNYRVVFKNGGNVGIGTTSPNATLDVNGNTIITGSITATAGGFDSDLTLKDIVTRDLTQYRIADSVSPIIYTWKDTSKGTLQRFGYGAQELLPLIPEAVYQNGSGSIYAVDYTQVHTVLIDENTKRIQALERELAELKQIINALVSTK